MGLSLSFPGQLELHSYVPISIFTDQSCSILTNKDSDFWTKLLRFGVLICMRLDQLGTRNGDCQLSSGSGIVLSLSTKEWRLLSSAEIPKTSHWTRVEQTGVVHSSTDLCSWRWTSPQGRRTAMLFSQLCWITIELFTQNKTSFFTTPQTGNSCWNWIGTNDHRLTPLTTETYTFYIFRKLYNDGYYSFTLSLNYVQNASFCFIIEALK